MARVLILDGVLTLWVTLSLLAALEAVRTGTFRRGWWLVASLACALGVLTKGPVAGLLLVVPAGLMRWLDPRLGRMDLRALLVLAGVVVLVNLPWYVAVCVAAPEFARYFLWEHNVLRFVAPFDHLRGVWFYVPIVLFGLLPGTLLLVPFLRFLMTGRSSAADRRTPALGFLVAAGGWCLLFFTLSGCKLPTYVLPAFPVLTLTLGYFLAQSRWSDSKLPPVVASCCFVFLMVGHHVVLPWYAGHRSPVREPEVFARYCNDPEAPVVCYPRPCNAVSFQLGRDDIRNFRSKDIEDLRTLVRQQRRTVILCTHRSSLAGLRQLLPPEVRIVETVHFGLPDLPHLSRATNARLRRLMGRTALGLCDLAVVEMKIPPARVTRHPEAGAVAHTRPPQ
jgi:hypothetical protein